MYKYKKLVINIVTMLFIFLSFIEFIIYLKTDSNLFGLIYLLLTLIIIFLLVPTTYNYKKYYSLARISKLIIIIILGLLNSFLLNYLVINNMNYVDSSLDYIHKIKILRIYLKPLLYLILTIITIFEFKGEKVIKTISNKNVD